MQKTPLAQVHENLGAKMVDFSGWYMPVQYEGLKEEHVRVRTAVGLFDVSHMGEIRITGPAALETVQWLTSNDASKLSQGQAQYSLLMNADGGIVDDLIVYCMSVGNDYLLCVNASNIEKDFNWMLQNNKFNASIQNQSAEWGQIAVQGPKAMQLLSRVFGAEVLELASFHFRKVPYKQSEVILARTGYTGEAGGEVFVPAQLTESLWNDLMVAGEDLHVAPIGLGARDTLRTEMKYPLYGHEIDDTTTPFEAGLGWVTRLEKADFIGKDVLVKVKEQGVQRKLVGIKMLDRGIARQGYPVLDESGSDLGVVTSGCPSPTRGDNIAVAYIAKEQAQVGQRVWVQVRAKKLAAEVVPTPFVRPGV